MMRRSNYVDPHTNPTARDSMAANAMDALDALAAVEDHVEEVPC